MDNEKDKEIKKETEEKAEKKGVSISEDKKGIIIKIVIAVVAIAVVIGGVLFACTKSGSEETTKEGLEDVEDEYGFEYEVVTDENGEAVTDENGNEVTTEVGVKYGKDKKGNRVAYKLDKNGEYVTDANGEKVTVPIDDNGDTTTKGETANKGSTVTSGKFTTEKTEKPTGTTDSHNKETQSGTSAYDGDEVIPTTDASGEAVNFSQADLEILKQMLEVPYLYLGSYESGKGDPVPISIAANTAVWMAARSSGDMSDSSGPLTYSANEIVLDLFKYYGQTVVNFKSQCNTYAVGANAPITYSKEGDTFTITGFTAPVQRVSITSVEDLGNNNFYKVTATVTGCKKDKVVAIVQKNRLEPSLGFSIKALKWT